MMTEKRSSFFKKHRDGVAAFLLLFIPIGWWLVFSGYPLAVGLGLGFLNWKGIAGEKTFVGFANFTKFFTDAEWTNALGRTIGIGMLCFACSTILGCLVAILLNSLKHGQGFFRTVWYLPTVTVAVATSQIFNILLKYDDGVINNMIVAGGGNPVYWQYSTGWMIFWIVVYSTWLALGGSTLIWLAAFQSIDVSIMEAAKLDGCNRFQTFWKISIPQMMPLLCFMTINGFIGAMNVYEPIMFISGGGPFQTTEVLAYKIMIAGFWDNDFGMAGCASFVVMIITVAFSAVIFRNQIRQFKNTEGLR